MLSTPNESDAVMPLAQSPPRSQHLQQDLLCPVLSPNSSYSHYQRSPPATKTQLVPVHGRLSDGSMEVDEPMLPCLKAPVDSPQWQSPCGASAAHELSSISYSEHSMHYNSNLSIATSASTSTPLKLRRTMELRKSAYINATMGWGCKQLSNDCWITVYGFPATFSDMVLLHFSKCGTILELVPAPSNGNWMHLKFATRRECEKALKFNAQVLDNKYMLGVVRANVDNIMAKGVNSEQMRSPMRNANDIEMGSNWGGATVGLMNLVWEFLFGR